MYPRPLTRAESPAGSLTEESPGHLRRVLTVLAGRPASRLSLHHALCCREARGWFEAMARSHCSRGAKEPVWITDRWSWGPNRWPLFWCEAVEATELDCGALADLAEAAMKAAGAEVCRVQLVESFNPEQIAHWQARWEGVPGSPPWIWGSLVYHETVGVLDGAELRIWDSTEGAWRTRACESKCGHVVALRPVLDPEVPALPFSTLRWEGLELPFGSWTQLPQA